MAKEDKDNSYQKIIRNIYGMNKSNNSLIIDYQEFNNNVRPDELAILFILSFARSGGYIWDSGILGNQTSIGLFWENKVITDITARIFGFRPTYIYPKNSNPKGNGFSVCWGDK